MTQVRIPIPKKPRTVKVSARKHIALASFYAPYYTYSLPGVASDGPLSANGVGLAGFFMAPLARPLPAPSIFGAFSTARRSNAMAGMRSFFANAGSGSMPLPAPEIFARYQGGMGKIRAISGKRARGMGCSCKSGMGQSSPGFADIVAAGNPVQQAASDYSDFSEQLDTNPADYFDYSNASNQLPNYLLPPVAAPSSVQVSNVSPSGVTATAPPAGAGSVSSWLSQYTALPLFGSVQNSSILIGTGVATAALALIGSIGSKRRRR
jgi:hypothetical protein